MLVIITDQQCKRYSPCLCLWCYISRSLVNWNRCLWTTRVTYLTSPKVRLVCCNLFYPAVFKDFQSLWCLWSLNLLHFHYTEQAFGKFLVACVHLLLLAGKKKPIKSCNEWKSKYKTLVYISILTLRSNSAKIQPTAHISTPTPYILAPNNSSGARYHLKRKHILEELPGFVHIKCYIF